MRSATMTSPAYCRNQKEPTATSIGGSRSCRSPPWPTTNCMPRNSIVLISSVIAWPRGWASWMTSPLRTSAPRTFSAGRIRSAIRGLPGQGEEDLFQTGLDLRERAQRDPPRTQQVEERVDAVRVGDRAGEHGRAVLLGDLEAGGEDLGGDLPLDRELVTVGAGVTMIAVGRHGSGPPQPPKTTSVNAPWWSGGRGM